MTTQHDNNITHSLTHLQLNYMALRVLVLMLAPIAPHISAEMWSKLVTCRTLIQNIEEDPRFARSNLVGWMGDSGCDDVLKQRWPIPDEEFRKKEEIVVAVQVGGKMRGTITVAAELKEDAAALERLARDSPIGLKFVAGKKVKKVIVPTKVQQPVVNFVLEQ